MVNEVKDIDAILSEVEGFKHTLHLYSSDVDKYAIQVPFLIDSKGGKAFYVTLEDNPRGVEREVKECGIDISIIKPEELNRLTSKENPKIVVDAASIDRTEVKKWSGRKNKKHLKFYNHRIREKYLSDNFKNSLILCTYDLGDLSPDLVRELAKNHDKLMLTRSDSTIVAAESLDKEEVDSKSVQKFIKSELEPVVLALLLREPMCGTDIIKSIHERFGTFLSPGTIYPLLHNLEERALVTCEYGAKTKTYAPKKGAKDEIRGILDDRIKVSRFLNRFLQTAEKEKEGRSQSSRENMVGWG